MQKGSFFFHATSRFLHPLTSDPLMITSKLDESGYKTMFRLYDASFEKIKE